MKLPDVTLEEFQLIYTTLHQLPMIEVEPIILKFRTVMNDRLEEIESQKANAIMDQIKKGQDELNKVVKIPNENS